MSDKEIHVFICEDEEIAKEIVNKYFEKGKITYASVFDESCRTDIVEKLDEIFDTQY